MEVPELRDQIIKAFACVPKPVQADIAPHRCMECDELAEELAPFDASQMPDAIFRRHVWDMPLLSAEAKHYYLPAWLLRCLEVEEPWLPDEASAVIYALENDHRWDPSPPYTQQQWCVLDLWLEHIAQFADSIDLEHFEKARERVEHEL
jgi:hypothetical protein